ncbi:MAG: prephenate dehydratase [Coriobacteriia bacterium]|nr:prephenate dehydratase [Coriobacteriia bacterium]
MATYATEGTTGSIAFLGPAGTYCDEAARRFAMRMGIDDPILLPCSSFARVFDSVDAGDAEYGVVALENSIEGPVTSTLDSFAARSKEVILGEEIVDIHHCLLTHPDAQADDIRAIASHPQALAQCRQYLAFHFPDIPVRPVQSTADAARLTAADPSIAAIANERAAELAGVSVFDRGIEDHGGDQTNFALISQTGHAPVFAPEGKMKTSLALYLHDDRPGALQMILSEFAYGGINLTKIQSRPTKRKLGEYMFFIDIDGSTDDEAVRIALDCLRLKLREVKVLGCYPAAPMMRS